MDVVADRCHEYLSLRGVALVGDKERQISHIASQNSAPLLHVTALRRLLLFLIFMAGEGSGVTSKIGSVYASIQEKYSISLLPI